ncbi:DUF1576 domain-containing protein [Caldisalinibacter kiritimatiensis]|uniref:Permeases of the major facilitator superfamily n=1 Tax=Caldisalinibacter kiritimatiensis TaxID=1304284 RepID=R1CLT2_9FIRM|nr:DUF1576 domain-containing protein [Caldisalinibacter kiritimatiensis]EOC99665.1 Permeases of the major facilitator superfamily [Caldisalinibacter kiritimatiensis]
MLKTKLNTKQLTEKQKISVLMILPLSMLVLAFVFDTPVDIIKGLYKIIIHPDILLTDYIKVGGIGAAFFNSAILTLLNIYILRKNNISVNGISMAAIFIIAGFAFFGKNLFNVWAIYLGGFIYTKYQGRKFKNVAIVSMFGTALAPLVNEIAYGTNLPFPFNIILGVSVGILVGFVLPPLSSHFLRTHDGYSLYNIGFTAGFIGAIIMSIMKSYGFIGESTLILSSEYDLILKIFLTSFFIILIVIGYFLNNRSFKGYSDILWFTGRLITDFTHLVGIGITLINMGIMGLIGMIYVIISNGVVNGPVIGGLLTIVGFSAFGKHPRNCIPILVGVYLAGMTGIWETNSTALIIAGLFGTTLAPIAGEYGWFSGILAGFFHLSLVMNVGYLHGGLNLYNNGFSGGIVASMLVPIIDAFRKGD